MVKSKKKGSRKLRTSTKPMVVIILLAIIVETVFLSMIYVTEKKAKEDEALSYGYAVASAIENRFGECEDITDSLSRMYYQMDWEEYTDHFDQMGAGFIENDALIMEANFLLKGKVVLTSPASVLEKVAGLDVFEEPEQRDKSLYAMETRKTTIGGPYRLVEGGLGVIVRRPIYEGDTFLGFTSVLLNWDVLRERVLDMMQHSDKKYYLAIWKENETSAVSDEYGYILNTKGGRLSKKVVIPMDAPNDTWYMAVEPQNGFSPLPNMVLEIFISALLLLALIIVAYFKIKTSEQLLQTVEIDELTGLYTKHAFYRRANEWLRQYPDKPFDLLITDVENFKLINSIYGEEMGDEVLKAIAVEIQKNTVNGVCGRYGNDQFVGLAFTADDRKQAWLFGMNKDIVDHSPVKNLVMKWGLYQNVDKSLSIQMMCDRCLVALKSIKHNYEQLYANYDGPISVRQLKMRTYETEFDDAMKNGEFKVWYQPKMDARTEQLIGAEALVRWVKADGTIISPLEFISVFEEDGLIARLDEYVFRKVCKMIRECMDRGKPTFPISVNLSRASIRHESVVDTYKKILAEYEISPDMVPIELTESASFTDKQIKGLAEKFTGEGFLLYMDDFGAGYSSLSSLNTMPFDIVKLDKSLVDEIEDAGGREIIRHAIEMAHFKEMKVIAEGVESADQLESLRELSCDQIQGYYYSKPRPEEDFLKYVETLFTENM